MQQIVVVGLSACTPLVLVIADERLDQRERAGERVEP